MATVSVNFSLSKIAQANVTHFVKTMMTQFYSANEVRERLRAIDIDYSRSGILNEEHVRAKVANAYGDKLRLQNVVVPVVMPQVEAAVAYLTEVFLQGVPIFAMSAGPDNEHIALQFNSILEQAQRKGAWIAEFIKFFRDGLKYNFHAMEPSWCEQKSYIVDTDTGFTNGIHGKKTETIWAGNKLARLDPYNTFFDPRVPIHKVHELGEFAGYVERMTHIQLRMLMEKLNTEALGKKAVFESTYSNLFHVPEIMTAPTISRNKETDWTSWAGLIAENPNNKSQRYAGVYDVVTMYARIVPADLAIYNAPSKTNVQIWKFIVVNNCELLWAERMTNAHNHLGIIVGQPVNDGLNMQTNSFATNITPFQDISSALWNMKLNSARRRLTDRMLYDPLRIRSQDINSPEPNAKIPVRSNAMGKPLGDAVFHMPFDDGNSQFFVQEAEGVINMAQFASGFNRVSQGQFQKGNKTLREFETTVDKAENRQRLMALFIQDQTLEPIKEILKYNMLQYQPAGEIYSTENRMAVVIDPLELRKTAADFVMSDGLSPVSSEMGTEEFQVALQSIQSIPQLTAGYRIVPLFSYIMQLRGLAKLQEFEKPEMMLVYEQQLQSWQQVAMEAVKAGQAAPPQPQMPPELVKFLQSQQNKPKSPFGTDSAEDKAEQGAGAGASQLPML